jgi:hypothetical protein
MLHPSLDIIEICHSETEGVICLLVRHTPTGDIYEGFGRIMNFSLKILFTESKETLAQCGYTSLLLFECYVKYFVSVFHTCKVNLQESVILPYDFYGFSKLGG